MIVVVGRSLECRHLLANPCTVPLIRRPEPNPCIGRKLQGATRPISAGAVWKEELFRRLLCRNSANCVGVRGQNRTNLMKRPTFRFINIERQPDRANNVCARSIPSVDQCTLLPLSFVWLQDQSGGDLSDSALIDCWLPACIALGPREYICPLSRLLTDSTASAVVFNASLLAVHGLLTGVRLGRRLDGKDRSD